MHSFVVISNQYLVFLIPDVNFHTYVRFSAYTSQNVHSVFLAIISCTHLRHLCEFDFTATFLKLLVALFFCTSSILFASGCYLSPCSRSLLIFYYDPSGQTGCYYGFCPPGWMAKSPLTSVFLSHAFSLILLSAV